MNLFDKNTRRTKICGHRHYTSPKMHDVFIDSSWTSSNSTKLFSIPVIKLHALHKISHDTQFSEIISSFKTYIDSFFNQFVLKGKMKKNVHFFHCLLSAKV